MQTGRSTQHDQLCLDGHWLNAFRAGAAGGFFAFDSGCWDRRGLAFSATLQIGAAG